MQFHFHTNQSHFHKNDFALKLALKQRYNGTRKWPIRQGKNAMYEPGLSDFPVAVVIVLCLSFPVTVYYVADIFAIDLFYHLSEYLPNFCSFFSFFLIKQR